MTMAKMNIAECNIQ